MVDLQHLHEAHAEAGLTVLGFDSADRPEIARDLLDKYGVTYPSILDTSLEAQATAMTKYRAEAVPTTYVIDRDGRVFASWIGHRPDDPRHRKALRALGVLDGQ